VEHQFYKSECGKYICRSQGAAQFEAWTTDGCLHWRNDNRIVTWADEKAVRHPMAYSVGGYQAEMTGQKKGSFTLNLLHCNITEVIKPGTGNTVIESVDVVFRRKIPVQNVPRWMKLISCKE
jgi:hypothetical protein